MTLGGTWFNDVARDYEKRIAELEEQLEVAEKLLQSERVQSQIAKDAERLADRRYFDTLEQLETLCGWIADEAEAGLPLPKPIRAIVEGSNPASEPHTRITVGPDPFSVEPSTGVHKVGDSPESLRYTEHLGPESA